MSNTTRSWLFVRGPETVRIVIDGTALAVYGPAGRFSHSRFHEELDATLHQASVEHALVLDGWTLEQITTQCRIERPPDAPGPVPRPRGLRIVPRPPRD